MFTFKSTRYSDITLIDPANVLRTLDHGHKVYAIGAEFFTGDVKTLKLLSAEKDTPLQTVKEHRSAPAYDKNGMAIPEAGYVLCAMPEKRSKLVSA